MQSMRTRRQGAHPLEIERWLALEEDGARSLGERARDALAQGRLERSFFEGFVRAFDHLRDRMRPWAERARGAPRSRHDRHASSRRPLFSPVERCARRRAALSRRSTRRIDAARHPPILGGGVTAPLLWSAQTALVTHGTMTRDRSGAFPFSTADSSSAPRSSAIIPI